MGREQGERIPSVVTGIIFLFYKEGKILVEDRPDSDKYFGGLTVIPGGKVDFRNGEKPNEALIREVEEEFGGGINRQLS